MGAVDDLAAICKATRESQGQTLNDFYGTSKTKRTWGFRVENPNRICPTTDRRYGSPLNGQVLTLIDRLDLTFTQRVEGDSCWADVERSIKGLVSIPEHDREMVLAAALGVFMRSYQTSVINEKE